MAAALTHEVLPRYNEYLDRFMKIFHEIGKLIKGHASKESTILASASLALEFTTEIEDIIPEIIADVNKLKRLDVKDKKTTIINELLMMMDSILVNLNEEIEVFSSTELDEIIWGILRNNIKKFIKSSIEVSSDGKLKKRKISFFCCA